MLQVSKTTWSETEEKIAKQALKKAYEREISALIAQVRDRASEIAQLDDLWYLHDLVKEGWMYLDELKGLKPETLTKISALARM